MSKQSDRVKKWRRKTKQRIIEAMGGCCVCCGYNPCQEAMDLHHMNAKHKEFSFSSIRANPKSWTKIVAELQKCILLCRNCHSEVHAGLRQLPKKPRRFDKSFTVYKEFVKTNKCPICGNQKPLYLLTCSRSCAARKSRKVEWDDVNLEELCNKMSIVAIGDKLGVSDSAVRKRIKKEGIVMGQ